ncbi:hypothetical protein PPERSA_09446 [Pseudocohnilembus persalinus]|uniref:Sodium/calcium exchanger membrane region domain-containing protein n=1 Tax=Pseudocohnilembus persalinus TaxID=266149 RepID=A0A0V0Q9K0_PSEPJ|nr:hypothetical protein PPERSA_09446 [Pseudocohnilembus persalinus]|eukprot:KRW98921.1 hypothetical protein PPERSA_09446 [Pseudocohnilembus persalinus]
MSCSYLSIYVAYIIVTIIQERLSKRNTLTLEQSLVEGIESEENQKEVQQLTEIYSKDILTEDSFHDIVESFKSGGFGKYDEITFNSQSNQKQQGNFNKLKVQNFDEIQYQSTKSSLINNDQAQNLQDLNNDNEQQKNNQKKWKVNTVKLAHYIKKSMINIGENFKDQGCLGKIILIWQSVSNLFLQFTIPPTQENWNKCLTVTSVLFGPLFFLGSKSGKKYLQNFLNNFFLPDKLCNIIVIPEEIIDPWEKDVYLLPVALFIGICFASLALKYTEQQNSPKSMGFLSILTFLNSLSWISLAVSILISYLNFLQFITSISKVYLGMTFLALGNSAGDFFTNGQLSKLGIKIQQFFPLPILVMHKWLLLHVMQGNYLTYQQALE